MVREADMYPISGDLRTQRRLGGSRRIDRTRPSDDSRTMPTLRRGCSNLASVCKSPHEAALRGGTKVRPLDNLLVSEGLCASL